MPSGTRMATICHDDHGMGRNEGRVPALLMAGSARALHIRPWLRTTNDGLNGVCGGECWPDPNDMHTDKRRPQRQTLDRISRTCTGRVAGREARRSGMLRAAHPLSSARRRRAPRWATQQPYLGDIYILLGWCMQVRADRVFSSHEEKIDWN